MKKRWMICLVLTGLIAMLLAPAASAVPAEGSCGEGLTWQLENYTLTISGEGEMEDGSPWEQYKTKIEHVVLKDGVAKVGAEAFYGCDRLETVEFGDALVEIGDKAFYGCEDITYIHLPKTFRKFGAESFRGCDSLRSVYCDGPMPRFSDSCLWTGNYIAVFFPTNNPWPYEYTSPLVSAYGGNLGIMMGNFDAANLPVQEDSAEEDSAEEEETDEEATEAEEVMAQEETQAVTEPATMPETVPETEETTTPVTEAPTQAPTETTEAPTEETTAATTEETVAETTEETEPEDPVKKASGDGWIGLVIIAGVLTMLLAGAMIFRGLNNRGRY